MRWIIGEKTNGQADKQLSESSF